MSILNFVVASSTIQVLFLESGAEQPAMDPKSPKNRLA